MKNRSRLDILGEILEAANESGGGGGITRNKILYKAFLSHNQMKGYLTTLTENNLLRYDLDKQTFKTTEKGLRFLDTYSRMDGMIKTLAEQQPV